MMDETKIVKVDKCTNHGCRFYLLGDECLTSPEMDVKTKECLSNTDDWSYLILGERIVCEVANEEIW